MAADPMVEPRRCTVEEYERMGEVGIIDPAERVELLDGEIVAHVTDRAAVRRSC